MKLQLKLDLDLAPERVIEVLQLLQRPAPPDPKRTDTPPPLFAVPQPGGVA
jgi:hypothetical protein